MIRCCHGPVQNLVEDRYHGPRGVWQHRQSGAPGCGGVFDHRRERPSGKFLPNRSETMDASWIIALGMEGDSRVIPIVPIGRWLGRMGRRPRLPNRKVVPRQDFSVNLPVVASGRRNNTSCVNSRGSLPALPPLTHDPQVRILFRSFRCDQEGFGIAKPLQAMGLQHEPKRESLRRGFLSGSLRFFSKLNHHNSLRPAARDREPGFLRLWRFPARVYANLVGLRPVSISTEIFWGPNGTIKVPSAPRNLGEKLSESLINRPPGVNRLVPFGVSSVMKRIPRIAICGPGRSGKDIAAITMAKVLGVEYWRSSSEAAMHIVWEQWGQHLQQPQKPHVLNSESFDVARPVYDSPAAMFADRINHREIWAEVIRKYNQPDGIRLYREMIAAGDSILCGIRRHAELLACQASGLVELSIWIDRPNRDDVTCEVTAEHCDVSVPNLGSEEQFKAKLTRLATCLGH